MSSSGAPSPSPCSICSFSAPSLRKLKTHLLLKHRDQHLCLFCVGRKGWSDAFASQAQYNEHYAAAHGGLIEARENKRREEADRRREERQEWKRRAGEARSNGQPIPKRPVRKETCKFCIGSGGEEDGGNGQAAVFAHPIDFERHLMSAHGHDYCRLCNRIGPAVAVRFHLLDSHPDALCHLCCGASPVFKSKTNLVKHLVNSHGGKKNADDNSLDLACVDCESDKDRRSFDSFEELKTHLLETHLTMGDVLRPMKKGRHIPRILPAPLPPTPSTSDDGSICNDTPEIESVPSLELRKVCGIVNESGMDCFAIAGLHLLAQTSLPDRLASADSPDGEKSRENASCIAARFFDQYTSAQKSIRAREVFGNYAAFGVNSLPVDCGDFLRSALAAIRKSVDVSTLFEVCLQWKFECPSCRRFAVTSMSDNVIRVDGSKEATFRNLLEAFLKRRRCVCGEWCQLASGPEVKRAGEFLLVEIDRACEAGDDSKEVVLYSLQLEQVYHLFGARYAVLGCINYNLDVAGGGHYVTKLFPNSIDCTVVHEETSKTERRRPDFDSDCVVVCLKRTGKLPSASVRSEEAS